MSVQWAFVLKQQEMNGCYKGLECEVLQTSSYHSVRIFLFLSFPIIMFQSIWINTFHSNSVIAFRFPRAPFQ